MRQIKFCISQVSKLVATAALVALAPSAFAASTWNFGTVSGATNPGGNKCAAISGGTNVDVNTTTATTQNLKAGNSTTCNPTTVADGALTATAWSTNGAGSTYTAAELGQHGTNGFGVKNTTTFSSGTGDTSSPQHSMDNANNGVDLIQLNFTNSTILDSVGLGWSQTDTDMSVFAYVGGVAGATTNIAGLTTAGILSKGWQLVGNYANLATTSSSNTSASASAVAPNKINAGGISSSWWLISAYTGPINGSLTPGNDYMKVLAVASRAPTPPTVNKVPEPGSLALLGAALMGFVATRRRKQQAV